jgi:hypothetical protein
MRPGIINSYVLSGTQGFQARRTVMNRRDFMYAASVGAASATMPIATVAQGNRDTMSEMP